MDTFFEKTVLQARKSLAEGGIPKVMIGENKTFMASEELLRRHGVKVIVLNDQIYIALMEDFIEKNPK